MSNLNGNLSGKGALVDTNNDGIVDGFAHTIKNAGNFNTFALTNGVLSIQGPSGGSSVGGSDTHVQFNDGGALAGESTMTYNKTTNTLSVSNLTVSDTLIVTTTTTLNSNTVTIGDAIIVLNSDATGSASANAGIEIERGDDTNVQLLWDETNDQWDFDGFALGAVGKVYGAGSGAIYTFTSDTDTGVEHTGTDQLGLLVGNTRVLMVSANGVHIAPAGASGAGSNQALLVDDIIIDTQTISTSGGNKNVIIAPHGTGSIELGGVSSNATEVTTTASAHNVVGTSVTISSGSTTAGTTNNIAGGSLTLASGQGKGTGAGGSILFKTADGGSSGSTLNPLTTKMTILDSGFVGIAQNTPTVPLHVGGDAIISGNLTVSGTSTTVSTTNTFVTDAVLTLNSGESGNGVTGGVGGFEVDRGANSGVDNPLARFVFDESDDKWKVQLETGSGSGSYAAAGLVASTIEGTSGTFTGDLTVDTNVLKVDATQNSVGIGTASPSGAGLVINKPGVLAASITGNVQMIGDILESTIGGQKVVMGKYANSFLNNDASSTAIGMPLRIDGSMAGGSAPQTNKAQSNSIANCAIGLSLTAVASGGFGHMVLVGTLSSVPASVFTGSDPADGDAVYVSGTAGKLTVDVPTTGFVQQVARIQDTNVSVSGNSGTAVLQVNIGTPIAADAYDDDDQGVTSIATSAPITGGTITSTGTIGISAATTSAAGSMSGADKTKLDGIETSADVTDETNVKAAIDGMTLSDIGTPASADRVLIQDADDSNNLKFADFSEFGGGGGGTVDVVSNVASNTILGRVSGGSGDSEELTATQVRGILNVANGATAYSNANAVNAVQSAAAITLNRGAPFTAMRSIVEDIRAAATPLTPNAVELMEDQLGQVLLAGSLPAAVTTIHLPPPASNQLGDTYVIINTTGGSITIDRTGLAGTPGAHGVAQILNGASANGTLASNEAVTLICVAASGGGVFDTWYGIGL